MLPSLADELMKAAQYRPQSADELAKAKPKPESNRPKQKAMIVQHLTDHGQKKIDALSIHINASRALTYEQLRDLIQRGKIERAGRGRYKIKLQMSA